MSLHNSRVDALLSWVNTLRIAEPIAHLSELSDCTIFIKLITKMYNNEEEGQRALQQPLPGRFQFICNFLQSKTKHCPFGSTTECMVDWDNLLQGVPSEIELSKVIVFLLYTISLKKPAELEELEYETQAELASILRFIVENEDDLCLNNNLATYLQKRVFPSTGSIPLSSTGSMDSSFDGSSPLFFRQRKPEVRFIDLHKVASTSTLSNYPTDSPSSPMNDVWHTPQFKMHRLKKQLTEERALRDEMEQELTDNRKRITEKDSQITIMQQRIERLAILCEKQADQQEPQELLELQGKHESLLSRLHDTLKQCQDLKTEKMQSERKIDQLTEQNGDLSFTVRNIASRLTQSQRDLDEISCEYEKAHHEWTLKEKQMEAELGTAFGEKKGLEEKILILQGKISLLEDQLEKMGECATQERGEVMGDILKVQMHTLEELKQEVVELTLKVKELQDRICLLEQEKAVFQVELESDKAKFVADKLNLNEIITNLQASLSEMAAQKAKLERESQAQEERLTSQINTLDIEIAKLNDCLVQRENEILNLHQQVEEERKQKGQLVADLQKQEQSAKESAEGYGRQVNSLSNTLKHTESRLVDFTQKMENEARQMVALTEAHGKALTERDSALMELDECTKQKETEMAVLSEKVLNLEEISVTWQAAAEEMKKEKLELAQKVQELDGTILDLIAKCQTLDTENEAQNNAHTEAVESLKGQLRDQECQLKEYTQKLAHKELQAEESAQLKQQLLCTEENIRNLQDLFQREKRTYAETLEERGKKISELEDEIQKLSLQRTQDQEELVEAKANCKRLEAQLKQLEEEYRDKSLNLQLELSQKAAIIVDKESALEKLVIEVGSWRKQCEDALQGEAQRSSEMDDRMKVLQEDHEKVCQQLQAERAKLEELEVHVKQVTSEQLEKQTLLQADLSKANALVKEKESEAQQLSAVVKSAQEHFEADRQAKADIISQLQMDIKKMTEEIGTLSGEITKEALEKAELESRLTKHEEKAELIVALESNLANTVLMVKEKELEADKLSCELQLLQTSVQEIQLRHEHEVALKEAEIKQLMEDKERTKADLDAETASKIAAVAEMEQSIQKQKDELSAMQNELAQSSELESEAQNLRDELKSLQENFVVDQQAKAAVISQLETDIKKMTEKMDSLSRELSEERVKKVEIEGMLQNHEERAEQIATLESNLANIVVLGKEKELEAEKLSRELQLLQTSVQEIQQSHEHEVALKEAEMKKLMEDKERTTAEQDAETASKMAAVAELEQSIQKQKDELAALQNELARSSQLESEAQNLRSEVKSLRENFVVEQQAKAATVSQLETDIKKMTEKMDSLSRELSEERVKKVEIEGMLQNHEERAEQIATLESNLANTVVLGKEKELEAEKLSRELQLLQTSVQEIQRRHEHEVGLKEAEIKQLMEDKERANADLDTETASKMAAVAELEHSIQKQKDELAALQNELTRSSQLESEAQNLRSEVKSLRENFEVEQQAKAAVISQLETDIKKMTEETDNLSALQKELTLSLQLISEKEGQLNKMTVEHSTTQEALKVQQETVRVLQGEVATMEALKAQMSKQESETGHYREATLAEISSLQAVISEKEREIESSEQKIQQQIQEISTIQDIQQEKLNEISTLYSKVSELECRCGEQQEMIASLQKEAAGAKSAVTEGISAAERQQSLLRALETEVAHQKKKTTELERLLGASAVAKSEQESTIKDLRGEILHKVKELENSKAVVVSVKGELSSMSSQKEELEKSSDGLKIQLTGCLQEVETKNSVICTLEKELASYRLRISEVEEESVQLKLRNDQESRKNYELEERMKTLQSEMVSATVIAKNNVQFETLKQEVDDFKECTEKQRLSIEELKNEISIQKELKALCNLEASKWQQKFLEKEEQMSSLQQELAGSQRLVRELIAMKNLHLEQQAQLSIIESSRRVELEHQQKAMDSLQFELKKATSELAELHNLRDRCSQQELVVRSLQAENASIQVQVCKLQHSNHQLLERNKELCDEVSQGKKILDDDLINIKEQHAQELEELKSDYQKLVGDLKEKVHDATKKLEVVTIKYDDAKMKVLEERQKFLEERQTLLTQVQLLEVSKNEQADQLEELSKKWSQQETMTKSQQQKLNARESEFQEEVQRQKKLLLELQTQLAQKEQSADHYKAQFEKAKVHYDSKKQHNLELSEELQALVTVQEQLDKENCDLKLELERLKKELQYTLLQAQDSEQNCKNLSSQVCSLEAQVSHADRQLRELGKFQVATDAFKSRDTLCLPMNTRRHRSHADVSTDSLDLSDEEGLPLNSTRKNGRSHHEAASSAAVTGSFESLASKRLPQKVESLESLYFTPIPNRVQSKLEGSIGSLDELSVDSSRKTRSARRRTTQVINITMTKKIEEEEPNSANTSFYSLRSAPSQPSISQQSLRPPARPQAAASVPSLISYPSQESLGNLSASSENNVAYSALSSLPGYKPATRSSRRLSQASGGPGTSRNSFYVGSGQDEPDPLEDFTRIAELQQRNRVCPPHLKTSYPAESQTTVASFRITDEELKTGDPRETLRRSTMLPSQIQVNASRRMTLAPSTLAPRSNISSSSNSNIATRQQIKRSTQESHQGPDTPESKKTATCFPRPMTPKDGNRRKLSTLDSKKNESQQQANRRQSMSFSILNTPKNITNSLLRRGLGKKTPTSKNSPHGSSSSSTSNSTKSPHIVNRKSPVRKSPRTTSTKSPKMQNKIFDRKQPKNKKL